MNEINDLGDKIVKHLIDLRRPVVPLLKKGMTKKEIIFRMEDVDIFIPEDLINLFTWKNGTAVGNGEEFHDSYFFPFYYLLSIDDAIESYRLFVDDDRWDKYWFPIAANGGGDFLAIFCKDGIKAPPIISFMLDIESDIEYENLISMFKTTFHCFEEEVYFIGEDGYFAMDENKFTDIANKFNPSLDR